MMMLVRLIPRSPFPDAAAVERDMKNAAVERDMKKRALPRSTLGSTHPSATPSYYSGRDKIEGHHTVSTVRGESSCCL